MALDEGEQRFMDSQDWRDVVGSAGRLRFVINTRGVRLCFYFWPAAATPKGIIQMMHGHGSYIPFEYLKVKEPGQPPVYHGSWIETINNEGYSVCALDNQGAGRSDGLRSYCNSFDEYVDDGLLLARLCTEMGIPGFAKATPKFLIGASMAGCLAVTMAMRERLLFSGVALLAPMISLDKVAKKGSNRVLLPLTALFNMLTPALAVVQTAKNEMYPDLQLKFDSDPICYHGKTRVRNASEYLRVTAWLMANLERVDFPFIVFHSENDTMCDCNGSKALYARASSKDKSLHFVNSMWHIISKEPGNDKVLAEVLKWCNERC